MHVTTASPIHKSPPHTHTVTIMTKQNAFHRHPTSIPLAFTCPLSNFEFIMSSTSAADGTCGTITRSEFIGVQCSLSQTGPNFPKSAHSSSMSISPLWSKSTRSNNSLNSASDIRVLSNGCDEAAPRRDMVWSVAALPGSTWEPRGVEVRCCI